MFLSYGPSRVALERAAYFTESFKTMEGQPLVYPELDVTIMKAGAEAFIAAKGVPDAIAALTDTDEPHYS